jgi:hypothetical protein
MKTYEFIESVKSLGYDAANFFSSIGIKKDGKEIATVWTQEVNSISTFQAKDIDDSLFKLILQYAGTPIGERKYQHPTYVEYEYNAYFVGRRYYMARHGELVIAKLAFGENSPDNQPSHVNTMPGLRGPAALLTMRDVPDNFGFYWICEPSETYDERILSFKELAQSTWTEDSPFKEENEKHPELNTEVEELAIEKAGINQ